MSLRDDCRYAVSDRDDRTELRVSVAEHRFASLTTKDTKELLRWRESARQSWLEPREAHLV